jgi:CHAT domain-containing protein
MKLSRYDSALVILQQLRPSVYQETLIRQNTAHCLFELGRTTEALDLYEKIPLDDGYTSVVALTDMGRIHMEQKDWKKAEAIFDSAIARNKRFSKSIKNKEEALSYLYRAKLAEHQGLTDEAISWSNEALRELFYGFQPRNQHDLPGDAAASVSPVTAFEVLTAKAGFLVQKFAATGQQSQLAAAVRTYRKAIATAAYIRMHFDNDEATLFFNQYNRQVFQQALDAAYTAYANKITTADDFLYMLESYKGNAMMQQMLRLSIRSDLQLPDSLARKEKELRQLIGIYTNRLNQASSEEQEKQLQKRLLDLEVALSRLQKSLAQNDRYINNPYRSAHAGLTVDQVKDALGPSETVLSYFMGDDYVYCLTVSNRDIHISKLPLVPSFNTSFEQFTEAVYHPREGMRYRGHLPAADLYQTLVAPLLSHADKADKWIIIPDGKLYLLPFDALVSDPAKKDYLVLKKTISYHYAVSLLIHERKHSGNQAGKSAYLALAPFVQEDSITRLAGIPTLHASGEETGNVPGKILHGAMASRTAFLQEIPRYNILHLATHASTGGDSSRNWIQFYPHPDDTLGGKLSIHEIYSLDLQRTSLVLLSACETAGGAEAGGEGLISLSRAFLYAGADGIISTLWKTEDQVTAFIMNQFRHYQQQGKLPEDALTLAKRDLLREDRMDARFQSPAYWSNFIYTGHVQAPPQTGNYLVIALTAIPLLGIGIWIRQRKKKTAA